jgi:hypothetical protein
MEVSEWMKCEMTMESLTRNLFYMDPVNYPMNPPMW